MSYAVAMLEARKLKAHLEAQGIRVSIELQPGVAGSGWYDDRKIGVLSHHVASRRTMGLTPFLALVKKGRTDVPGPLCNGYMGFDRVYRIITMGWANHPGRGGPLVLAGHRIPRDNGRPYLWGTEYEGGLDLADFTTEYRVAMARANAAILHYLDLPVDAHAEHLTWAPGRKIDRKGYTAESGRAEIRRYARPIITPEDDMPFRDWPQEDKDALARHVWAYKGTHETRDAYAMLRGTVDLPKKIALAVLGYKKPADAHSAADPIDFRQIVVDLWQKATGKPVSEATHPRDRQPGDF